MKKIFFNALIAVFIALSPLNSINAASRSEISAINVQSPADFLFWDQNSPTLAKIIDFVEDISNPYSENFIPTEDRIATFDLDGTIYCETAPYYFKQMMFLHRVLDDQNFQPSKDLINIALSRSSWKKSIFLTILNQN